MNVESVTNRRPGLALSAAGRARVHAQWAARLGVPMDAFAALGTTVVDQAAATAVVVVELDGACVMHGPPAATARLDGLDRATLLDDTALTRALHGLGPRPIGTAGLSYRDAAIEQPARADRQRPGVRIAPADDATIDLLRRTLTADEWDESGLSSMPRRWAALTPAGAVAAVAGYERWADSVAQVGVATNPGHRQHGHATALAGHVVTAAVDDGLVAQWRCRLGNTGSERVAAGLGFTRVGQQTAVLLGAD